MREGKKPNKKARKSNGQTMQQDHHILVFTICSQKAKWNISALPTPWTSLIWMVIPSPASQKEAGTCALVFPVHLSAPTDDLLQRVKISSASVRCQPPAMESCEHKNPRKAPCPAACQYESRQYFYSLHCLSAMSLQKTYLSHSLSLASPRKKLPLSTGAVLHSPPLSAPALPYSPY